MHFLRIVPAVLLLIAACSPKPQAGVVRIPESREAVQVEGMYNPVCPMGVYMADPSAKVIDGKLYIACSLDETLDRWCSPYHHLLSTGDLRNWTLYTNVLASQGPWDAVSYSTADLYAPDIVEKDGKYYMYYDLSDWTEGVAFSDQPQGPFTGTVDAARACLVNGGPHVRLMEGKSDREILAGIVNGSKAAWKYIDFPEGIRKLTLRVRALDGGHISVAQNQSFSGRIADVDVPSGKGEWITLECEVKDVKTGPHALWFMFSGKSGGWKNPVELSQIDWFRFE